MFNQILLFPYKVKIIVPIKVFLDPANKYDPFSTCLRLPHTNCASLNKNA